MNTLRCVLLLCIAALFFSFPAKAQNDSDPPVSIAAVGDVMLGTWVVDYLAREGPLYPFAQTLPNLSSADITIANLEAPLTLHGERFEKKFNFKIPPQYAVGLKQAGFDVVTLANNHMMDFGETGLRSTLHTLDSLGIGHSGAGLNLSEAHKPVVVKVGNQRIAFLGYSMTFPTEFYATEDSSGTAYPEPEILKAMLTEWDRKVDFIVTSFHWSAEKLEVPKDYQIFFAHMAIDHGADLVLGHHPHVLQGLEIYKNRLIAYSLGNFAFGSFSNYARDSIILKTYLNSEGLLYARCVPINVNNIEVEFQPAILAGARRDSVIQKLNTLSRDLNQGENIVSKSGFVMGEWSSFYNAWLAAWPLTMPIPDI